MITDPHTAGPLATLRRIARSRPAPQAERCDMCATPLDGGHPHVVDLQTRQLMCACRACYLLFTDSGAHLRYRAVPDRHLSFPGPVVDERSWDELQIPVGLAFLFALVMAANLAMFLDAPGTTMAWGAAAGGLSSIWVALGIGTVALFERRPAAYTLINGGYWVVVLVVMGAILGGWR